MGINVIINNKKLCSLLLRDVLDAQMRGNFRGYFLELVQLLLKLLPSPLLLLKLLMQGKDVGFIAQLGQTTLRDRGQLLAHHTSKGVLRGSAHDIIGFLFVMLDSLNSNSLRVIKRAYNVSLFIVNSGVQGLLVRLLHLDLNDLIDHLL